MSIRIDARSERVREKTQPMDENDCILALEIGWNSISHSWFLRFFFECELTWACSHVPHPLTSNWEAVFANRYNFSNCEVFQWQLLWKQDQLREPPPSHLPPTGPSRETSCCYVSMWKYYGNFDAWIFPPCSILRRSWNAIGWPRRVLFSGPAAYSTSSRSHFLVGIFPRIRSKGILETKKRFSFSVLNGWETR